MHLQKKANSKMGESKKICDAANTEHFTVYCAFSAWFLMLDSVFTE